MTLSNIEDTSRRKVRPAQTHRFIAKREAILDAAARHFNRHGLKGATLADVAASVDLLTNSVTYYYRRKEDLAAACLLRSIETTRGLAVAARPSPLEAHRACSRAPRCWPIRAGRRDELVNFNDIRPCARRSSIMSSRPIVTYHAFAACRRKARSDRLAQCPRPAAAFAGELDAKMDRPVRAG